MSSSTTGFAADPNVCGSNCGKVLVTGDSGDNSAELFTPYTVPTASVAPTSLNFGSQTVGQASAIQTVTLTGGGPGPVSVTGVSVSGAGSAQFTTSADTCTGHSLSAGQTCTVAVAFDPSAPGTAAATLSFVDNATGSTQTAALSGTGTVATTTTGMAFVRLAGVNRIATAIAVSKQAFATNGSAQAVVLARDDQYPDALAGVPLAAAKAGPLLLTETASLDSATQGEIQRVLPAGGAVYLLGGSGALDPSIDPALQALGYKTTRVAGGNRFATAVAVATQLGDPSQVFEVTGTNFPDAVSAGPAAIANHGTILLTNGSTQAADTFSYLGAHTGDHRTAIGGPAAAADPGATGVGGPDRFATSAAVAATFFPTPKAVGLATGLQFPDALAGGPLVGGAGGPILLVAPGLPLPPTVASYLSGPAKGQAPTSIYVFGGSAAIGDDVAGAAQVAVKAS